MRALCLDLSTSAGTAVLEGEPGQKPELKQRGLLQLENTILSYGSYPFCYWKAANDLKTRVIELLLQADPDVVVIEETNLGKNRYSQKTLEFIHCQIVGELVDWADLKAGRRVVYFSSSEWRSNLELILSKEQRKNNDRLRKAKKRAVELQAQGLTKGKALAQAKKEFLVKGKITKKHLAVNRVNEVFGLNLKIKDNDVADAICLGLALFNNATPCDGT